MSNKSVNTRFAAWGDWNPPGWQRLEEDVPHSVKDNFDWVGKFEKAGLLVPGKGKLTAKGEKSRDIDDLEVVIHNLKLLRDAWGTHESVWWLAAELCGVDFKSDPFYNPGCQGLPELAVKLDGSGDTSDPMRETSGLAYDPEDLVEIEMQDFVIDNDASAKKGEDVYKVEKVKRSLPRPLNWRGRGDAALPVGECPAAVNGPHSDTEEWLKLCVAYGQDDIVAAFVPQNGDGWFQRWAMTATIVVRLGRVACNPAPGIAKSSPRGANALLIWVPEAKRKTLPKVTRDCITKGRSFRVPLVMRPKAGVQYAFVQPGACERVVDFGLIA